MVWFDPVVIKNVVEDLLAPCSLFSWILSGLSLLLFAKSLKVVALTQLTQKKPPCFQRMSYTQTVLLCSFSKAGIFHHDLPIGIKAIFHFFLLQVSGLFVIISFKNNNQLIPEKCEHSCSLSIFSVAHVSKRIMKK